MEDAVRFALWLNIQRITDHTTLNEGSMIEIYIRYRKELDEMFNQQ